MEFSSPNIKKILIFSQKRIFLYFVKWNFLALRLQNFYTLQPQSQNVSLKKISYIFSRK